MITLESPAVNVTIDSTTLATTVTDRRNGAVWVSENAGLVLQTYHLPCLTTCWYRSDRPDDCRVSCREQTADGAVFEVLWTAPELACEVRFSLAGERLTIDIPDAGWQLGGERLDHVLSLDVLPGFGGRPRGSDGYLVLPHAGGCRRFFRDHPDRAERMRQALDADARSTHSWEHGNSTPDPTAPRMHAGICYGDQSQWRDLIAYPLWGTVVGDSGWAAWVPFHHGDADTAIVVTANRGPEQRCAVHGRCRYREHGGDVRVGEDRRLVYTFLHDDELDYSAVARAYRDHLLEAEGCRPLRDKPDAEQALAYWLRPMLGLKRFYPTNNPNPDGRGIFDIYMTCDELDAELRRLKNAGMDGAIVQIVGIANEGHDGNHPSIFPFDPRVGGIAGMRKVLATCDELGYASSMHLNLRTWQRASFHFNADHVIRDRDGNLYLQSTTPGGDGFHGCPASGPREYIERNFPRLLDLDMTGGIYIDFILGVLFRCYHPRHPLTRRGYLEATLDYMRRARDAFGSLRVEHIVAPAIDLLTGVARICAFESSAATLRGSLLGQYGLADEPVPLAPIVFHGQVFHGIENSCLGEKDYWAHFLRLASIGAKPIEEHRGAQPQWDDFHVLQYRVLCRDLGWLQYEFIDGIKIDGDLTETVYSDGTTVRVNHGNTDLADLPARSLHVIPGNGEHEELRLSEDRTITDRPPAVCPQAIVWPDNSPREGVTLENRGQLGRWLIGKDFA